MREALVRVTSVRTERGQDDTQDAREDMGRRQGLRATESGLSRPPVPPTSTTGLWNP